MPEDSRNGRRAARPESACRADRSRRRTGTRQHAGLHAAEQRDREFADSPLEGGRFEPSVPRRQPSPPWPFNLLLPRTQVPFIPPERCRGPQEELRSYRRLRKRRVRARQREKRSRGTDLRAPGRHGPTPKLFGSGCYHGQAVVVSNSLQVVVRIPCPPLAKGRPDSRDAALLPGALTVFDTVLMVV
jgi:hypothetical protein